MRRRTPTSGLALCLTLLLPSLPPHAHAVRARGPAADCEGSACQQVAVTFDSSREQYRVENHSSDRWVKVAGSNVAAFARVCVGPGKAEYLPLKSISGAYRADYAEDGCAPPGAE